MRFSERHPELKQLNIGANDLNTEGFLILADYLSTNQNLEVLELGKPNGRFFSKHSAKVAKENKMTPNSFSNICKSLFNG